MNENFAAATKQVEEVVATAKQNLEGMVKAQQEQIEKASAQVMKGYEDIAALAKANVEAVVASTAIVAKGAEEAGKQVAAYQRSSAEAAVANGKAVLTVKTAQELFELQSGFFKATIEAFTAESGKLRDLSVKIANEAIAPISARVNATVELFAKPVAI